MEFMSNDVRKPVRYATSLKKGIDKVQFWRVLLKHYAHPLKDWIDALHGLLIHRVTGTYFLLIGMDNDTLARQIGLLINIFF